METSPFLSDKDSPEGRRSTPERLETEETPHHLEREDTFLLSCPCPHVNLIPRHRSRV